MTLVSLLRLFPTEARAKISTVDGTKWHCHTDLEQGGDGFLTGVYGRGSTPRQAALDALSQLRAANWFTADGTKSNRARIHWNGDYWEALSDEVLR